MRKPGQICIDGKTLTKTMDEKGTLHLVSAFAAENGLVLGCKNTDQKGKEIPTIKELLNSLGLKSGDIVTIDAIGCQKEIVDQIKEQKADYLIALKKNPYWLWSEVENFFEQAFECEEHAPVEKALRWGPKQGREDSQKIWVTRELDWLEALRGVERLEVVDLCAKRLVC